MKRHKTYFSIPIPPFKRENYGAGTTTIRFVLTGKVPSKKNNQQAIAIRKFARQWAISQAKIQPQPTWADVHKAIGMVKSKMRGNIAYLEFIKKIKPIIIEQMQFWSLRLKDKGLIFPLSKSTLSLQLYFKDRYITDTVNKQQTIQDVLVECGVISNDDYKTLNPIHSESASFYEEIIYDISFISLSFKL